MDNNQGMPEQPVNPIVDALEQAEPVQVNPAPVQPTPVVKKKSSATVLSIILLLILALGGIGFGVWAWMDSNSQKDNLNQQISDLKKQNSELLDKIAEYESKTKEGPETEDDSENFYIEEWGLNIRMPDSISNVEYEKSDGYPGVCDSAIGIKSLIKNGKKIDAGDLEIVASVERCTEEFPYGTLVYEDDAFKYYYVFPNGLTVEDPQEVQDAVNDLKSVLNNKENYSKI